MVFYLTMESIGKVHPSHRLFDQWGQMSDKERQLQLEDMAECYLQIAEKYQHSAIFVHPNPGDFENVVRLLEIIRERSGDKYFIMMHGDTTYAMPDGDNMMEFSVQLAEEGDMLKEKSRRIMDNAFDFARRLKEKDGGKLLDGFALCSDYCFNVNPFFTKDAFAEFIAPVLKETIDTYRSLGYYSIKHTDGNIMPILDQMIACKPDAFHSLDPQGGVDLKEMKRICGNEIALIGNVNCGLLQTRQPKKKWKRTYAALSGTACRDTATFSPPPTASTQVSLWSVTN